MPDGTGLPPGGGTTASGADVYAQKCASCHGATGVEGPFGVLVGRRPNDSFDFNDGYDKKRTIGNYWPYATTLFDYIRRAMPLNATMSLTNSEYYSLTAYLLHENGIIAEDDVINKDTLPKVEMPNRDGFVNAYPEIPEQYRTKP